MHSTTDHGEIREWAKARGVVPRLHDDQLSFTDGVEVAWDEWFERFDAGGVQFRYDPTNTAPRSLVYEIGETRQT